MFESQEDKWCKVDGEDDIGVYLRHLPQRSYHPVFFNGLATCLILHNSYFTSNMNYLLFPRKAYFKHDIE